MIGELSLPQIHEVLHQQLYGRLACRSNDKLYVVPVSYAFDGEYIYAHSKEGQKIEMLRKNGHACFQVDIINALNDWRSVIVWGKYQELDSPEDQATAIRLLDDRFGPLHISESISRPSGGVRPPEIVEKKKKAVYFRISIEDATGRFEKSA